MEAIRINIPSNIIGISRPGSRRRLFTTKINEERIRLTREDWKEKFEIRLLRREDLLARIRFREDLEKSESVVKLQGVILARLAKHENSLEDVNGSICKHNHK